MLKKIILTGFITAVLLSIALGIFSRKAPALFLSALEKKLERPITVDSIDYHFPAVFEIRNLRVKDTGYFSSADAMTLGYAKILISWTSLSAKSLIIDRVIIEEGQIFVRRYQGKVSHIFSDLFNKNDSAANAPVAAVKGESPQGHSNRLKIDEIRLIKSRLQWVDYDVKESGLVTDMEISSASFTGLSFPFSENRSLYHAKISILQGRDQKAAELSFEGWTAMTTLDTEAKAEFQGLYLPYFEPYMSKVAEVKTENGYLAGKVYVQIRDKKADLSADLQIANLFLSETQPGEQLFGMSPEQIFSYLKDRSGRFKFYVLAKWDLADRSVKSRDVLKRSIERSVKMTILGNIETILENALLARDEGGADQPSNRVDETIKKIKDLLKY